MTVQLKHDTGGTVTLQAPATGSNTMTIPVTTPFTEVTLAADQSYTITHDENSAQTRIPFAFRKLSQTSSTLLLMHCNGANGATSTTDEAGNTIVFAGSTTLSTAQAKFGTASLRCNGGNNYAYVGGSAVALGTSDFCAEGFIRFATLGGTVTVIGWRNATGGPCIQVTSTNVSAYSSSWGTFISGASTVSTNTWYHFALHRTGSSICLHWGGNKIGNTYTSSATISGIASRPTLGTDDGSPGANTLDGWLDEIRVQAGTGVNPYGTGSTITVPTGEFGMPTVSSTWLDCKISGTGITQDNDHVQVRFDDGGFVNQNTKTTFTNKTGASGVFKLGVMLL